MIARHKRKSVLRSIGSGLLLLVLTSCGGSSDDDAPTAGSCDTSQAAVSTATFDELWTKVFSPQCTACHGLTSDPDTIGGPNLQTADAFYASMVGKKGSDYDDWRTFQDNRAGCVDKYFIQSGNANQSMVAAVLDSSVSVSGCTVKFHRNEAPQNVCITDGNLAKLKEWINAGAAR